MPIYIYPYTCTHISPTPVATEQIQKEKKIIERKGHQNAPVTTNTVTTTATLTQAQMPLASSHSGDLLPSSVCPAASRAGAEVQRSVWLCAGGAGTGVRAGGR